VKCANEQSSYVALLANTGKCKAKAVKEPIYPTSDSIPFRGSSVNQSGSIHPKLGFVPRGTGGGACMLAGFFGGGGGGGFLPLKAAIAGEGESSAGGCVAGGCS
jgi:hypothetical protein